MVRNMPAEGGQSSWHRLWDAALVGFAYEVPPHLWMPETPVAVIASRPEDLPDYVTAGLVHIQNYLKHAAE